jgi:outer membrane protein assembly factor BamB
MSRVALLLLFAFIITAPLCAEDWPQFRGVRGDGTWQGPRLPEQWPDGRLKVLWKKSIGGGYAGISTVGDDFVFTMDRQTEPTERERVLCYHGATGELAWIHEYPVKYEKLDYGNGPRATPTVYGSTLITVGALGDVRCLDRTTGKELWSKNYQRDFGGQLPTWGYAGSAVIHRERLLLSPGGDGASLVALDPKDGKEIWRTLSDAAGYATPIVISHQGREQIVHWTPSHIRGVDFLTGSPLWDVPYEITYGVSIAKPIFQNGLVYIAGYWHGSKAIRPGDGTTPAAIAWEENRFLRGLMSQPLYRDGYVYLLDKQYGLTCFELATGKKLWDDKNTMTPRDRNPHASLAWIGDGDRIIALNAEGELILARINPSGYHETARTKIIGFTWAHPAFSNRRVIARSDTEIVCVELPTLE